MFLIFDLTIFMFEVFDSSTFKHVVVLHLLYTKNIKIDFILF